jgi:hypothetical protein
MKAFETTGRIEKSGVLKLDKPLTISRNQRVKVIILYTEEDEIDDSNRLSSVKSNPGFDFFSDKKEDVYSLTDGKPFNA